MAPEINARRIKDHKGIIANPNCAAITTLVPLWPVHQVNPVKRLIVSTYQAASGGGAALMEELELATRAYLDGKTYEPKVVKHPYAFNLFSHNTAIDMATGNVRSSLLLGFILGPMMEENLRRALLLARGDWTTFFTRPLSAGLLIAAALMVIVVMLPSIKNKREEAFKEEG